MVTRQKEKQRWWKTRGGQVAIAALTVLLLLWAVIQVIGYFHSPLAASNTRMFVCSETGKAFEHTLQVGDSIPIHSPYSGKDTGYPAEACYWTKDGKIKTYPTWVLMNSSIHISGPTFCPDCGRLVIGHNPMPHEGGTPPLTRDEYYQKYPNAPRN